LSAILVKYQWLTWAVRILGGGYLIFLGIRLIRAKPQAIELDQAMRPAGTRAILFGFLVTLTNPKAIVLFASVFATAVTASTPLWLMGLMIALVTASSLTWYSCVSLFMSSGPVICRFQRARHWIERAAGVCFIGLGGKVLADAGNPVSP
jgi:threonine/homoserine/homoserine lactone efflux protein